MLNSGTFNVLRRYISTHFDRRSHFDEMMFHRKCILSKGEIVHFTHAPNCPFRHFAENGSDYYEKYSSRDENKK
ncbi:hypothetical protein RIR_jg29072.t1 [Rhizophagus irregularis DAOM 181602=DAOM 197198]|uniref:Uncharacterized protein n=1 Tax=Rhizophagus irregularis (strain DAOM 197198w) TaxID=1432141 RepID=A0A015LGX0_RHIIW|nr:hypothetical protein RirG_074680 [Rhizophagus irregularis DAOM 197198w]GBC36828.1 hypothetical protein RIR_jg29072.t1 [Rhizophagus irregularis DAOM 181602=DAOM 197198]